MDDYPCQLVNPLCPDDLCVLRRNHRGPHRTGTMAAPGPVSRLMRRHAGPPLTAEELVEEGWRRQAAIWPEEAV